MLKKHTYTIAFVSWMILITCLSLFTLPGDSDIPGFDIPNKDKAAHFIFYFGALILGCFFLREQTNGTLRRTKAVLIIGISVIIYGIIIEVIQEVFTEYRTADIYDALANCIGALAGAVTIKLLFSGKRPLKWKI
ncbi:VanZ family protein [Muriicola sp. Z0-33]|uniref:VanZ family protein n=1 Tax=Muriicola sp. Z0-33 TaxID=2816957 RepID=UPI00223832ED|nr:VanZ family protein [Muriicola sp. Z0-33]